jgi:hypothetical protein
MRCRWLGPITVVAVVLTLTFPAAASGSLDGSGRALPPPNNCAAPLLPCYIVLSIGSGSHGNNESVTGARFWPGDQYTVYFWNETAGAPAAVVASGSTGTGGFSAYFRVPKDPIGNYTVFVTDLAGDNQSAPFHLTRLSATPNTGPVGTSISLSGGGFLPDHVMEFHVHGDRATTAGRCLTNRHGEFSACRVTVPNVPTGTTRLTATDGTYDARVRFVVN